MQKINSQTIKFHALELGFDLVGITPAVSHPDFTIYQDWIDQKFHGTMDWMSRGAEKRSDPQKILPGAKSFICVGLSYYRGHPKSTESHEEGRGWISNYAWGEDYHEILLEKLKQLEKWIGEMAPQAEFKSYVDTGPILERSYAQSAGLGWIGKNTVLINHKGGSYFFIGEILTHLELEPDTPGRDHCGTCTRCLDACPTQALTPYQLNTTRCISYLTIEHKGEIPLDVGHQVYGCDICQDVCPWNRDPLLSRESAFDPRAGNFHPLLDELQSVPQEKFAEKFKGSPIKRLKWERLQRNLDAVTSRSFHRKHTEFHSR